MPRFNDYPRATQLALHRAFAERSQALAQIDADVWVNTIDHAVAAIDAEGPDAPPYAMFIRVNEFGRPALRGHTADLQTAVTLCDALIHKGNAIAPVLTLTLDDDSETISPIALTDVEVMQLATAALRHMEAKFAAGWNSIDATEAERAELVAMIDACSVFGGLHTKKGAAA
jgi:hypothetical protein